MPTLVVETLFDIGIVLHLAGFDGMHAATFNPQNGFPYSQRSLTLLFNIALILHSTLGFIKMPVVSRVNSYFLGIHFVLTILISLFQDSYLIYGQELHQKVPYLQLFLLITFFGLKFCAKQGIRHFFKPIARWDNFNAYIKERLFFEHFESFEQLKHISLDNRRHI